jgi:uncharacterized protein
VRILDSCLVISGNYGIIFGLMRDVEVLVNAGCTPEVIAHCRAVSQAAVAIVDRMAISVDRELVRQGGLLHDIGRSRTHGIEHAIAGVEIARRIGFSDQLVLIIERHIGAGITAAEAARLGLPQKEYIPITPEEKIVSYADNLMSGTRVMSFYEALERFRSILGPDHEGVELFIKQHQEIQGWMR